MKMNNKKTTKKLKAIVWSQVFSLILEIFAFSFILGGMSVFVAEKVEATDLIPKGCCTEAKDGSICQDMNMLDKDNCKNPLLPTECNYVDECKTGCCYDANQGICSFNSPKSSCENNGGNWSNNPICNIAQCQIGCCILGNQASITTTRECTLISQKFEFEKKFVSLDSDGTCNSKTNLDKIGACVIDTKDFSGQKDCKFTAKEKCKGGEFYEDTLCTAKSLGTICKPSKNTACVEGKDQIYYLDTCGNTANIYDAKKFSEQSYWEKVISAKDSCSVAGVDCGNCDYMQGSKCYPIRKNKDSAPTYGNNVCRNLNCANGKKHGESWCVSDYINTETPSVAPVGTRAFRAKCFDGEISIEPCADFNQERCISNQANGDNNAVFSEARCIINNWRACVAANDKETYSEVEAECKKYPDDCVMFLNIPGNEKYENLPGFIKGETSVDKADARGRAGDVGKDSNKVIPFCVPKYTPGMVFWSTQNPFSSSSSSSGTRSNSNSSSSGGNQQYTGTDYGGSIAETKAICSLGSFTCASHKVTDNPNGNSQVTDKENPQCNMQAESSADKEKVPLLMEALNERCRALGPCGVYVNVNGELGSNNINNASVKRIYINPNADITNNYNTAGYEFSNSYKESLAGKVSYKKPGSIAKLTALVIKNIFTGNAVETDSRDQATAESQNAVAENEANIEQTQQLQMGIAGALIPVGWYGGSTLAAGTGAATTIAGAATTTSPYASIPGGIGAWSGAPAGAHGPIAPAVLPAATPAVTSQSFSWMGTGNMGASALSVVGVAAIGATLGYFIGKMIAKNSGMTPGETESFIGAMMGLGAAVVVGTYWAVSGKACASSGGNPIVCLVAVIIAVILSIIAYFFTGEDHEYYITQYTCDVWTPPETGDCSLCNNDVRTCSEYRCRSLGQNCHYFADNGEPGWCATLNDIWSATIKPWPDALTTGNKYADISDRGFKITGSGKEGKVNAWDGLQFGIITSKQAQCKIDSKHTKNYDEMSTQMIIANEGIESGMCAGGKCTSQGLYHKVALSSYIGKSTNSSGNGEGGTLALKEGENNYYIRCKNFAGQANSAEFAVKIIVDASQDLSPPIIKKIIPESGSYIKIGENSKNIIMYVNEPSECKYSQNVNQRFEEMKGTMNCLTSDSSVFLGEWPCYAKLSNLTAGENKFYFQCKDQPDLEGNRSSSMRNINRNSKEYSVKLCSIGLNITSISPNEGIIVTGKSPISLNIKTETSGCINGGEATCYYNFGSGNIAFLNTGEKYHTQNLTSIANGNYNIRVTCIDVAGNSDNKTLNVTINLDNSEPTVLKAYSLGSQLIIQTNEDSQCKFITNSSLGCSFDYDKDNSTIMSGENKHHTTNFNSNQNYYIKCSDIYGNTNLNCGIVIKTYRLDSDEKNE